MKHFNDKLNSMSKHCIDSAVITNNNGKKVGSIVVRYTDSQIGWNNETGIIFYFGDDHSLNFSQTKKGSTYNQESVFDLLRSIGAKVYGYNNQLFVNYSDKEYKNDSINTQNADSISRCSEFTSFKIGNFKFNILWV